jgi:hypothetical protein
MSTLRGVTVTLATTIAACGLRLAQHPPAAIIGNGEAIPVTSLIERQVCDHARRDFPRDHVVIEVPDMVPIDCNPGDRSGAIHLTFYDELELAMYR